MQDSQLAASLKQGYLCHSSLLGKTTQEWLEAGYEEPGCVNIWNPFPLSPSRACLECEGHQDPWWSEFVSSQPGKTWQLEKMIHKAHQIKEKNQVYMCYRSLISLCSCAVDSLGRNWLSLLKADPKQLGPGWRCPVWLLFQEQLLQWLKRHCLLAHCPRGLWRKKDYYAKLHQPTYSVPPVYEEKITTSDRSPKEKQAPQQLHKTRGPAVPQTHDTYHTKIVAMDGNRLASPLRAPHSTGSQSEWSP